MECIRHHELEVLASQAGYYIGTRDPEDNTPYCRISQYYKTPAKAAIALDNLSFVLRDCIENRYCAGGFDCIGEEEYEAL